MYSSLTPGGKSSLDRLEADQRLNFGNKQGRKLDKLFALTVFFCSKQWLVGI